jgi:hypothetical protein
MAQSAKRPENIAYGLSRRGRERREVTGRAAPPNAIWHKRLQPFSTSQPEALVFNVDWTTVDVYLDAELQFLEAHEKSGADTRRYPKT